MSSSSSEGECADEDVPCRAECDSRIADFVGVTHTDEAYAQMRLQKAKWKLQEAIERHFVKEAKELGVDLPGMNSSSSGPAFSTTPPDHLTFMTWNIDGLDQKSLQVRTKAVVATIRETKADVVFLQEVIQETLSILKRELEDYQVISNENGGYFTAVLLRRFIVYLDSFQTLEFPTSKMGRNLTVVECHVGKAEFVFMNTHLESTKDHAEERMKQFKFCMNQVKDVQANKTVIFGGDLNMRDSELTPVSNEVIPANVDDLWVRMGSRKECKYTWDMTRNTNLEFPGRFKPRCRFDRVLLRDSQPLRATPETFVLVGISKVPNTQTFPSDHWGILANFKIKST